MSEITGQMDLIDGSEVTEELSIETIVGDLLEGLENEIFSPYKVWKVMSSTFEALGIDQKRPSQMMYNYDRNGLINGTKGAKRYTHEEVKKFVTKFVTKHTN